MKKVSRLLVMIFLFVLSSQQLSAQYGFGNYAGMRIFQVYDREGNRIMSANEMGINGSPLMREGWGSGTVNYLNGKVAPYEKITFSLFENKLYYSQNTKLYQVVQPIAGFNVSYLSEEGDSVNYRFKNGFPTIDKQDQESLYEVLFEGENLELLQWNHKKIKEVYTYGSVRQYEFVLEQRLYVYQPKEQKITPLKQAIPAIKKTLPAYADIIKTYFDTHTASIKDKEELVYLMAYLDTHH